MDRRRLPLAFAAALLLRDLCALGAPLVATEPIGTEEVTHVSWDDDVQVFESENLRIRQVEGVLDLAWNAPGESGFARTLRIEPRHLQGVVDCGGQLLCSDPAISWPCFGDCLRGYRPVLFDRQEQALWITTSLAISSNAPIVVLRVDLPEGSVHRLFEDFSSGLADFVISPTRRFVAYRAGAHGGWCDSASIPRVVDLTTGKRIRLEFTAKSEDGTITSALEPRWKNPTRVEFRTQQHRCVESEFIEGIEGTLVVDATPSVNETDP